MGFWTDFLNVDLRARKCQPAILISPAEFLVHREKGIKHFVLGEFDLSGQGGSKILRFGAL